MQAKIHGSDLKNYHPTQKKNRKTKQNFTNLVLWQ